MKNEVEIRELLEAMRLRVNKPCNCSDVLLRNRHTADCRRRTRGNKAVIDTLKWVLGESNERIDGWVEDTLIYIANSDRSEAVC